MAVTNCRLPCVLFTKVYALYSIIKPLMFALKDKESRSRTLFHDVPENRIVETLANFGIQKHMLLTDMGGSLEFGQRDWIASRRAAEMEEI